MLAIEIAAVLAALFVCSSGASVNYCGAAMCGMSNAHTFCQYTEGPGPRCSGYIDDRLSGEEKTRVIGRMNRRRNEAALGKLQLPPASNMLKLRWVEDLAREAQIWADQCSPPSLPEEHDACRDLFAITVGQCVASLVGEAPGLRPESMVDMWYLQGRQSVSAMHADETKSSVDFTQMLWAHTYLVGCARSRFMIEQNGRLRTVTRLVCNFAPRGPEGPLWAPGAPASDCPTRSGPDPELPGLCVFHQDLTYTYNVTNATDIKEKNVLDTILDIERNDSLNYHGSLDQLYLTKMMAASITSQIEQQYPLVLTEKNNTVEFKTSDQNEIVPNVTDDNKSVINDFITKMVNETSTARVIKKILSTVGRPKSYNMEELYVVTKDAENGTTMPVAVKEDDPYNDYELDDILEGNEREFIPSVTENQITTAIPSIKIESPTETTSKPRLTINILQSTLAADSSVHDMNNITDNRVVKDETTTPYVQNDILKRLLDLSEKTDENPSDPETARQLEEALDNMEKALEFPLVSSKVRRELPPESQPQEPRHNEPSPKKELPQEQSHTQKLQQLGTPDTAPIMAILTRYAPLMKKYDIFSRSFASNTNLSSVLFVLGCLFSNSM